LGGHSLLAGNGDRAHAAQRGLPVEVTNSVCDADGG